MTQNFGLTTKGEYTPDALVSGTHPVVEIPVTIAQATSNTLSRGQILGVVTSTGKYTKIDPAKSDGSQLPKAILGANVDAKTQEVKSFAYVHGEFDASSVIGITASLKSQLQAIGIYVKG